MSLVTYLWDIDKQCRPKSESANCLSANSLDPDQAQCFAGPDLGPALIVKYNIGLKAFLHYSLLHYSYINDL